MKERAAEDNLPMPVKEKKKKMKSGLFLSVLLLLAVAGGIILYKFLFLPKQEESKARVVVEACFDALKNGDADTALTYTDYDKGMSFSDYMISSEQITSDNILINALISLMRTDEEWKSVLNYGLANSVRDYEIKEIHIAGNEAVVYLEVKTPDFKTAVQLSEEKIFEIV